MDRRIRPWINKKIIEYIGEEEATLVDFVCSKVCAYFCALVCFFFFGFHCVFASLQVMAHSTPQGILDDVAMVSCYSVLSWFVNNCSSNFC